MAKNNSQCFTSKMGLVLLVLATLSAQIDFVHAETDASSVKVEVESPGSLTCCELEVADALGEGLGLSLWINIQDGVARQTWALIEGNRRGTVHEQEISLKDNVMRGRIVISFGSWDDTQMAELALVAELSGDAVSGTLTGRTGPRGRVKITSDKTLIGEEDFDWERTGDWRQVSAAVTGRIRDESDVRRAEAVATDAHWPMWGGPNQNFSVPPRGLRLVEDLNDARLVWMSELTHPARCQVTRYGEGNLERYLARGGAASGGSSPIVYQGRVYLRYVRPCGDEYDENLVEWATGGGKKRTWTKLWSTYNDDVILCCDAATGQTLWKSVLPKQGKYLSNKALRGSPKRGAFTSFMCAAEDRVFVRCSNHTTLCLDAKTGELVWSSREGGGELFQVIDGVLVIPTGSGVVGLSIKDGTKLWEVPNAGNVVSMPLCWKLGDKTYVIAGGNYGGEDGGDLVCIDPRDGTVVWRVENVGMNRHPMCLVGDIIALDVSKGRKSPAVIGAYRLSPQGANRLWSLDPKEVPWDNGCYPSSDGRHLFHSTGKGGKVLVIDLNSGRVVGSAPKSVSKQGQVYVVEDRVLMQLDGSHSATDIDYFRLSEGKLTPLNSKWPTLHQTTSGYSPVLMTNPIVDGRLIIRGSHGIACYDLRQHTQAE